MTSHGIIKYLSKMYGWELSFLLKYRDFKEGITFSELKIEYDKYIDDHKPSFRMHLILFNYTIFEFDFYFAHHVKEEEIKTYEKQINSQLL